MFSVTISTQAEDMSAEAIKAMIHEHARLQNIMFRKGSTTADADNVYALYTDDYTYNHPGQGDEYSRELLYNNTVRYIEQGGYNGDGSDDIKILRIITGKNAATFEWTWASEPNNTNMTLAEFKDGKFSMMKEYW